MASREVETLLRELQQRVRDPREVPTGAPGWFLRAGDQTIRLPSDELARTRKIEEALRSDLRFEHMRNVSEAIGDFVVKAWSDRELDGVAWFVTQHAQTVVTTTCVVGVEYLIVKQPTEIFGVTLVPLDDPRVPEPGNPFRPSDPARCAALVEVEGTDSGRMGERARTRVREALRRLRVSLGDADWIVEYELRFRVGWSYAFAIGGGGLGLHDDEAVWFELGRDRLDHARQHALSMVEYPPVHDVDKRADLTLRWIERAQMSGEPMVAMLFLFFALEGLLGQKHEVEKASPIAFRQAVLSSIRTGEFRHPDDTWNLYADVRSAAVHGSDPPEVSRETLRRFAAGVYETLRQFIELSRDQNLLKRSKVLTYLDKHADAVKLEGWLQENGGVIWATFLDGRRAARSAHESGAIKPADDAAGATGT